MSAFVQSGKKAGVWRLVAVALLPLAVVGLLLAALWNPAERLDTVRAAIVNLDEPVTVDGQLVPLGRQLAAGLVSGTAPSTEPTLRAAPPSDTSYEWEITNAETARRGLEDGTYAAVVTIPRDFSAAATSFGGENPLEARKATIDVATPPGGRVADGVLARVVASAATSVMGSALTETYVDNVLVGFTTLSGQIGQAADGAGELADGATSASDGALQLWDGALQLADGVSSAADGASELSSGASQLASGARSASSGASQLASGARQAASGAAELSSGASGLADGAGQLATGAQELAAGVGQSKAGAEELATGADQLAGSLGSAAAGTAAAADGVGQAGEQLGALGDGIGEYGTAITALAELLRARAEIGCDGATPPAPCAQEPLSLEFITASLDAIAEGSFDDPENPGLAGLAAAADAAAQGLTGVAGSPDDPPTGDVASLYALANGLALAAGDQGAAALAAGARDLADGLGRLATGADQVASGSSGLQSGAGQLASGASALQGGVEQVADGASSLSTGVGQLASGARGLASGADSLADGLGVLASGAEDAAEGAGGLADGVSRLAGGAGTLAGGLGRAADEIPSYSDGERAALAHVVANPVEAPTERTLDTGSTGPLFAVVALWLGALALTAVVRPSPSRALLGTRGGLRVALEDLALPGAIGIGTGTLVGVVLAWVEGMTTSGWFATIGLGALVSVVFVAVHQGFCLLLGDYARGVSLLMAVLIIATGVVATVPQWLESLADGLAIGAARRALTGVVVPGAGGVGPAVAGLVAWGLVVVGLAVFATARARTTRVPRLLAAA